MHPRVPPLVRSLPHLEALSLFKAEQSQEEIDLLKGLKTKTTDASNESEQEDIVMTDQGTPAIPTPIIAANTLTSTIPIAPIAVQAAVTSTILTPNFDHAFQSTTTTATPPAPLLPAPVTFKSYGESEPKVLTSRPAIPIPQDDGDEDDEMPAINMESDSDDEE